MNKKQLIRDINIEYSLKSFPGSDLKKLNDYKEKFKFC